MDVGEDGHTVFKVVEEEEARCEVREEVAGGVVGGDAGGDDNGGDAGRVEDIEEEFGEDGVGVDLAFPNQSELSGLFDKFCRLVNTLFVFAPLGKQRWIFIPEVLYSPFSCTSLQGGYLRSPATEEFPFFWLHDVPRRVAEDDIKAAAGENIREFQ